MVDSPYNGLAFCQAFPRGSNASSTQYWAQVGPADTPVGNFDNMGWSMLTIFTIFTGENWVGATTDWVGTLPGCAYMLQGVLWLMR